MKYAPMSLRQAYVDALIACGRERQDFVILEADALGSTFVGQFVEKFPQRHIKCGIAEQNMIGMAAGMSTTGIIPIANTMAVFVSLRAVEQFRTSVCYPKFNAKLAVSHLGIDIGEDGPTQACIEDIGVLGSLPNLVILSPGDPVEMHEQVRFMLDHVGPVYLRTGRSPVPQVLPDDYVYEFGVWPTVREGRDVTIAANGIMVHIALKAAELLAGEGIDALVLSVSTIKPVNEESFIARARKTRAVVTAEDHNIRGGVASVVSEILAHNYPMPVESVGLRDRFAESGTAADLFKKYGLTAEAIADAARRALKRAHA